MSELHSALCLLNKNSREPEASSNVLGSAIPAMPANFDAGKAAAEIGAADESILGFVNFVVGPKMLASATRKSSNLALSRWGRYLGRP